MVSIQCVAKVGQIVAVAVVPQRAFIDVAMDKSCVPVELADHTENLSVAHSPVGIHKRWRWLQIPPKKARNYDVFLA